MEIDILSEIEQVANNGGLSHFIYFDAEDWINSAPHFGASPESIELMKKIEKLHPKLSSSFYFIGMSGQALNPAKLTKWVVERSKLVGARRAYDSIKAIESSNKVTAYNFSFVSGMDFSGVVDFGDSIYLTGYQQLPNSIKYNVSKKARDKDIGPCACLWQPMEIELFSDIDDEHIEERVQSFVNKEILISNFLSLFAIRHAPCVDRRYILLEEHVPMSGIFDSAHSTYLEIKRPRVPETWNNVDLDKMSKLFSKYMRMDIKQRRQLDISLSRRVQAMNSWDSVNKAIDLGIALESVLTTPKTREQLSLQIRILGSKLAAKEDEMREKVYSTLKTVYRIRSEAVHNGALDNHYKVKGEGNKNTRDIINDGLDIQRNCLIAIIEMNGLTQEDIDRLMIIK